MTLHAWVVVLTSSSSGVALWDALSSAGPRRRMLSYWVSMSEGDVGSVIRFGSVNPQISPAKPNAAYSRRPQITLCDVCVFPAWCLSFSLLVTRWQTDANSAETFPFRKLVNKSFLPQVS